VGLAIGIPVALAFYAFLLWTGTLWWLYAGLFMIFISIFLARIAPVVIFPLFYKFREIENEELKDRLNSFMKEQGIPLKGIYSFDMSRDTRKANAGFTGLGKTERIILSDTLIRGFSIKEILTVFAHELGHYRRRHIIKNLLQSAVIIFASFYLCGITYRYTIPAMGFTELYEISAIRFCYFISPSSASSRCRSPIIFHGNSRWRPTPSRCEPRETGNPSSPPWRSWRP
jgi:STE24 endopeptidase